MYSYHMNSNLNIYFTTHQNELYSAKTRQNIYAHKKLRITCIIVLISVACLDTLLIGFTRYLLNKEWLIIVG